MWDYSLSTRARYVATTRPRYTRRRGPPSARLRLRRRLLVQARCPCATRARRRGPALLQATQPFRHSARHPVALPARSRSHSPASARTCDARAAGRGKLTQQRRCGTRTHPIPTAGPTTCDRAPHNAPQIPHLPAAPPTHEAMRAHALLHTSPMNSGKRGDTRIPGPSASPARRPPPTPMPPPSVYPAPTPGPSANPAPAKPSPRPTPTSRPRESPQSPRREAATRACVHCTRPCASSAARSGGQAAAARCGVRTCARSHAAPAEVRAAPKSMDRVTSGIDDVVRFVLNTLYRVVVDSCPREITLCS